MTKVMVETSLEDFPQDASSGSPFFHNVTAANVGYFSIPINDGSGFINWEKLKAFKPYERTKHFKQLRLENH